MRNYLSFGSCDIDSVWTCIFSKSRKYIFSWALFLYLHLCVFYIYILFVFIYDLSFEAVSKSQ